MIVYKVVRRTPKGNLISGIISFTKIIYSTSEPTIPKVGKIFVFSDYRHASNFVEERVQRWPKTYPFEIWRAEASGIEVPYNAYLILSSTTKRDIRNFWKYGYMGREDDNYKHCFLPAGTLVCNELTLMEKMGGE